METPITPLPPPGRDPRVPRPAPLPIPEVLTGPVARADAPITRPPVSGPTKPAALPPTTPISPTPLAAPPTAPPAAKPARRPRRELTPQQRAVTAVDEAGFATLETELGGRPALLAILAGADLNSDEARVMGLLADPLNDAVSLAKVCIGAGISMGRLMKLFQAAAMIKGQTKAIQRIAERLPDVAAAIMEDAVPGMRTCPTCEGLQTIPGKATKDVPDPPPIDCPVCRGKGIVAYAPEHQVREMALRIGGLLDKGGAGGAKILIANQNNGSAGSVADTGSFDKLMAAIDGQLYGEGRARQRASGASGGEEPIEGEVI